MKIYTKTGDEGSTALFGGPRVDKDDTRISSYGTVDELNAYLGLVRSFLEGDDAIALIVRRIQDELFIVGAELATPADARVIIPTIESWHIDQIEREIDEMDSGLPDLRQFIVPSGTTAAATLHVARTVCRRAERLTVTLGRSETVRPQVLAYLNRLSDLLFVAARRAAHDEGSGDDEWSKPE